MKQFIYFLSLLTLTGCKRFLDVDLNKSQIPTEKVFSNDVTATAAVTAIYYTISANSALSGWSSGLASLTGLSSGELFNYPQEPDYIAFQEHAIRPDNPYIEQLWNCMYNIIYQTNAVLEGIHQSSGLSAATAKHLEGEALFIRAYTYFYLVNLFGDVPLAVETNYHKTQSLSRRPVDDVYALIETDLLSAQSLLSNEYITAQRARPNKATAAALLARMYLYRQEYAKANEQASSIISDPAYQLTAKDSIDKTFLIDSKETIWQLMPVFPYTNTPEANSLILTTIPYYHAATDALRSHFEAGDLRLGHWINSFTSSIGIFYFPYKYKKKDKTTKDPYTEASVAFRLAEIYLIRAEARAHLNDVPGSQSDLDAIRTRAGLAGTGAGDQQSLLMAVESERLSELFVEYGHRWLDLKRTGRAVSVLGNGITVDDLLYPIPASEFIKNPHLGEQNHGY